MRHKIQMAAILLALVPSLLAGAKADAGFFDIFRSDLEFSLVVDRTESLMVGDPVDFEDNTGRREVIGRIAAIPDARGGEPVVVIRIDARYKDRVRAGSRVVVDRPWIKDGAVRVYIVTPPDLADSEPLRSGAVVQAQTPMAGKAQDVVGRAQAFMAEMIDRSRQYLDRLRTEIDRDEFDRVMDQLKQTGREVGRYSREQKERFAEEVLPELERLIDVARRRLKEMQDSGKQEELEREVKQLKEQLEV